MQDNKVTTNNASFSIVKAVKRTAIVGFALPVVGLGYNTFFNRHASVENFTTNSTHLTSVAPLGNHQRTLKLSDGTEVASDKYGEVSCKTLKQLSATQQSDVVNSHKVTRRSPDGSCGMLIESASTAHDAK